MDDRKPSPPSRFARLRRKCATSCYVALSLWLFLASTVLAAATPALEAIARERGWRILKLFDQP